MTPHEFNQARGERAGLPRPGAGGRGRALGTFAGIALWCLARAAAQDPAGDGIRIFADTRQSGELAGPLSAEDPGFCVVVPLPDSAARLDAIRVDDRPGMEERLARIRVENAPAGGTVRVACRGIDPRLARMFRLESADRRWVRIELDGQGTCSVGANGRRVIEAGVAVVLPPPAETDAVENWPTRFTIEVGLDRAGAITRIPCRVAPFIVSSALDPVDDVLIVERAFTRRGSTGSVVDAMSGLAAKVGFRLVRHETRRADVWMQDTIEPGFFGYPAGDGPRFIRAVLTGVRKEFGRGADALDVEAQEMLRRAGFVTIEPAVPRKNTAWIDWYGNLEATPPFVDADGRRWPYGRILYGRQGERAMHPGVLGFLEAQGLQWPAIEVDTSWLVIGHVDEVVSFVPAKNGAGFRVLLPSPKAARAMLEGADRRGLGKLPVFANTRAATTVAGLLDTIAASDENRRIDEKVAAIEKQIARELNLEEADFVRLPVLFERGGAVIPNSVNSLVVNGHVLVPDPRGPVHEGKDLFAEAIVSAMATCDVKVVFVDVWDVYHVRGGELHCGTNTVRRPSDPAWWSHRGRSGAAESR